MDVERFTRELELQIRVDLRRNRYAVALFQKTRSLLTSSRSPIVKNSARGLRTLTT